MRATTNEITDIIRKNFPGLGLFTGYETRLLGFSHTPEELATVVNAGSASGTSPGDSLRKYIAALQNPKVANVDNRSLGAFLDDGLSLGWVNEVNGPDAAEVAGFTVTRHELIAVMAIWLEVAINIDYEEFLTDAITGSDMRRRAFAWSRVFRITKLLGSDTLDRVGAEVLVRLAQHATARYWKTFLHGTDEERREVQALFRESREDLGLDSRNF